ncbi:CoaE-domain-containing protein, partial [Vararia minispora EC-137]
VIGLTGGIATGKSTVSSILAARGLPIIDADVLAREVVQPGTRAHRAIVREFGTGVLLPDGSLDRPKLGAVVFNDERKRRALNAIVHPAVRYGMLWAVIKCWMRGERVCVLDVPLLIEAGFWRWVGKIVVVYCSAEIQMQRLQQRDGSPREAAQARIQAQMPIADKLEYADAVIDNSGGRSELETQVDGFVRKLDREVGELVWRLDIFPPFGLASAALTVFWRWMRHAKRARRRRGRGERT